jgi:hypothetical protein
MTHLFFHPSNTTYPSRGGSWSPVASAANTASLSSPSSQQTFNDARTAEMSNSQARTRAHGNVLVSSSTKSHTYTRDSPRSQARTTTRTPSRTHSSSRYHCASASCRSTIPSYRSNSATRRSNVPSRRSNAETRRSNEVCPNCGYCGEVKYYFVFWFFRCFIPSTVAQ